MIPEVEITVNSPASPLWLRPVGIVGMVFSYMEVSENEEQAIDTIEGAINRAICWYFISVLFMVRRKIQNWIIFWRDFTVNRKELF